MWWMLKNCDGSTDSAILLKVSGRGVPDPEFCYPAGSASMPDPDQNRILVTWMTTVDNRRKIALSAPLLEKLE